MVYGLTPEVKRKEKLFLSSAEEEPSDTHLVSWTAVGRKTWRAAL